MYSARNDQVNLDEIFSGTVPSSVSPLVYTLKQLDGSSNPPLEESIRIIYSAFMREVEDRLRMDVFQYLVQEVIEGRLSPESILAVIRFETNHYLVNKAVGAYLQHKRVTFEDPFAAARIILNLLQKRTAANPGAVFAGLVCFGDRRVCALARAVREHITLEDARAFSLAASGPLQRPTIEFCMEWLVQLMQHNRYEVAIQVAYALSSMVTSDATLLVHDVEYNFGPYGFSRAHLVPPISFEELLTEMGPLVELLSQARLPALTRMLEILQDPARHTLDRLDQRKTTTRRMGLDRRVSDRRIVNIQPRMDRRSGQRRSGERRVGERR